MFSYEDQFRAAQVYIKLDKRIGLTIRQLGYPTRNAPLGWHRGYEQCFDLPAGYVHPPRYSRACWCRRGTSHVLALRSAYRDRHT
jgi:hypothetical protein